jgi:tetratricopeptide (TPR) repeat protein
MLVKYLKIITCFIILFQNQLYSKTIDNVDINSKDLSNYFSAILSYNNSNNTDALKFFNLSKILINKHDPYLKKYIFSLVLDGQISKAIQELKYNLDNKNLAFFEAYLILTVDSIEKKDFDKSLKYLEILSSYAKDNTIESAIYESLKDYLGVFKNKSISSKKSRYSNLSMINESFQNCYLGSKKTNDQFLNLINQPNTDYSRYVFFYTNYLVSNQKFEKAKNVIKDLDELNINLLVYQTKEWVKEKKFNEFKEVFSCKNEADLISEFLFLISTLYSSENNFEKSNFYLYISNYLNPKFRLNLTLLVDNYYRNKNYNKSETILKKFKKTDGIYYWYKIKKKTNIIANETSKKKSLDYINSKFQKIKNPSIKIIYDMANIMKGFKKYKTSIIYYNSVLSNISKNTHTYADILYRRGSCYERILDFKNSDKDLLSSLEINPDDAYVLNYLAYSWLERDYKIDDAIKMLELAHSIEENDPYILDSVGWAYYLINDFINAEKYMQRAIKIMPNDPTVNDHYGDILWRMDRKIEAKYYWKGVLNIKETEDKMKKIIKEKLIQGLKRS